MFRVRQGGDGCREAAPTVLCFGDEERNKCDVELLVTFSKVHRHDNEVWKPPRHIKTCVKCLVSSG